MKLGALLTACLLPVEGLAATRFGKLNHLHRYKQSTKKGRSEQPAFTKRQTQSSPFLNDNTSKFLVNGTGIPEVNFDVGESFAGSLPIGEANNGSSLFFWFFPTTAPDAPKDIVIWLNGGPGCSSLSGMLKENGPFLWSNGVYHPVANPWSWHHLANVVWIEQPVGTGFSVGTVTVQSEDDVAQQFMGFWKNFVDAFGLQGYSVYVTGESYAGAYCPFIASNMLDANDTTYFDVKGMIIYDPVISGGTASVTPTNYFLQYWQNVFPFNDTAKAFIANASKACGLDEYSDKYLTFPPAGQQPGICETPAVSDSCDYLVEECDVFSYAFYAISYLNPGFDIYQVASILPVPSNVLGFPFAEEGQQVYFNRTDVKRAIHAPENVNWEVCADAAVFAGASNDTAPLGIDDSDPSSYRAIPNVIERTNNVHIAHGINDMRLIPNGTLLAIQNMTWNGQMGFQSRPRAPLFVPHHLDLDNVDFSTTSGEGVLGTWHEERGLTWLLIDLCGHMVPTYQTALTFRQLEVLLGRVGSLDSTTPLPQFQNATQPDQSMLGLGTAPP